ncbi:MAG: nitroreductase family protein [bacterium]|jgi:nitroreductase
MDALQVILSRRSIRKYTDQSVSAEIIDQLLKAAMSAPSAHNQQPWRFVVIRERTLLDEVPKFHPYAQMLKSAPVAILVCGDEKALSAPNYWPQDCAAAMQNILLAAHALNLGAVWLGVYPRKSRVEALRELLNIPPYVTPFALVALGYPAEEKPPANRYDPSHVHYDRW